ncbi:MAG: RidA family protein [Actinobacteria bacterium]|nr:RidA family protein [Actinomycetota bacterium]
MSKMKYCNPKTMATPGGHYSHVVVANGMAFISGQLPITAAGQQLNSAGFEDQAKQVLINLQAALEAAVAALPNGIGTKFRWLFVRGDTFPRYGTTVDSLGAAIGLTRDQVDDLFIEAQKLADSI